MYFKEVDPKLRVADLKAEVGELRSDGIPPNLIPAGAQMQVYRDAQQRLKLFWDRKYVTSDTDRCGLSTCIKVLID